MSWASDDCVRRTDTTTQTLWLGPPTVMFDNSGYNLIALPVCEWISLCRSAFLPPKRGESGAQWRRLLDQRTGAANDVPGPQSVLDDTSKQPPDCFRIRRLGEERLQSGFGVQDESADRLVDFANRRR